MSWTNKQKTTKIGKNKSKTIGELKTQVQYDLMCQLKRLWYREDAIQANEQLSFYVSQQGAWDKRITVEFIGESLYDDMSIFEYYFPQLNKISQENSNLWNRIIPVFVDYVRLKEHEEPIANIVEQVLQELERIPNDTEKTKHVFIAAFVRSENFSEHLSSMVSMVMCESQLWKERTA